METGTLSYWLNWRFFICATWVLASMVFGSYIIRKYEGLGHYKNDVGEEGRRGTDSSSSPCNEGAWRTCVKEIHPFWLLGFRITALCLLLAVMIIDFDVHGGIMYFYYTQWTFTMVTVYFGLGSILSIYGCFKYQGSWRGCNTHNVGIDAERGFYVPLSYGETTITISGTRKSTCSQDGNCSVENPGICGYVFQVMFQISAGAVMLTDCIYWFLIFPFLTIGHYSLNPLTILLHSLNAVLLFIETALNCLRFPWFRFAYFVLLTGIYVVFQWIIHACISIQYCFSALISSSGFKFLL